MRMPFTEFLTNGDLKFVLILYAFLIAAVIFFVKKNPLLITTTIIDMVIRFLFQLTTGHLYLF